MTAQVPNQYRQALGAALSPTRSAADGAHDPFAPARAAMVAGAWRSSVADAFAQECAAVSADADRAAQDCLGLVQGAYNHEPASVDGADYRARWYSMRGMR